MVYQKNDGRIIVAYSLPHNNCITKTNIILVILKGINNESIKIKCFKIYHLHGINIKQQKNLKIFFCANSNRSSIYFSSIYDHRIELHRVRKYKAGSTHLDKGRMMQSGRTPTLYTLLFQGRAGTGQAVESTAFVNIFVCIFFM